MQQVDRQVVMLSRIVLHPDYRGLGLAHRFVRESCHTTSWPWIECLSEMGRFNSFLERAGFQRIGVCGKGRAGLQQHSALYGTRKRHGKKRTLTKSTFEKSRYARPIYYLLDNREHFEK
ncbi:hypothetical protein Pla110_03200 [Polystyrenella longa]|uniref:N-acetyltransferase domain-containing protein n=1 Tax=Polystyrenella longa TaxID=2528007 RepID=A0A518CHB6_9PLAN|nr:hypothetical protein [Polystyrenella longa]QDU78616.1 hypothetical protein Pla110_03200 [Polystyrenella longa]